MRLFKPGKCIRILGFSVGRSLNGKFGVIQPSWFIGLKELFTYRILLYRKHAPHLETALKLGYSGRYLYLLDKENKPLPGQINLTIIERLNQASRAKVELFINISEFIKIDD